MLKIRAVVLAGCLAAAGGPAMAQGAPLPAGTTACAAQGYSVDADPKGANVRAGPTANARVVGKLAPPQKSGPKDDAFPNDGVWRTAFRIIGYRDGWFLIEGARHPFDEADSIQLHGRRPTGGVKTFRGRGWVAAGLVGGQFSNAGNLPSGALFAEPDASAKRLPAKNTLGADIGADGGPKRVLACRGGWVQVESGDGVIGWWNSLCSSQVTNCS